MIGDIVLVTHTSTFAALNVGLQRVVSPESADSGAFSHVAIGSGPWQIFHAMPAPAHIEFALVQEVLDPKAVFEVFRNRPLANRFSSNSGLYGLLRDEFSKHIGGAYNVLFSFRDDPDFAFCSQLVGRIAESLGSAFPEYARWLLPNDIANYVQAHDDWYCVTGEYQSFIASDAEYKRLWSNPNSVDAKAFRAAYERAKLNANQFERAFAAMQFGERPQTRLTVQRHAGLMEISQTIEAPPEQREPTSGQSNPFCYRQSVREWDKHFQKAATQLSEEQYRELLSIQIPTQDGRELPVNDPRISSSCKSHDAVFVLADERTAKISALMFDSLIPLGTDRIPEDVCAWGAPATWRRGSAEIMQLAGRKLSAPRPMTLRVTRKDGSIASLDPRDPLGAEETNSALVSDIFLSEPEFFERVLMSLAKTEIVGCPAALASRIDISASGYPDQVQEDPTFALAIQDAEIVDVEGLSWADILHIRAKAPEFDSLRSFRNVFDKALLASGSSLDQSAVELAQRQSLAAAKSLRLTTRKVTLAVLFDREGPLASVMTTTIQMAFTNLCNSGRNHVGSTREGVRLSMVVVPGALQPVAKMFGLLYLIDWVPI